jgi:hypothetical protein
MAPIFSGLFLCVEIHKALKTYFNAKMIKRIITTTMIKSIPQPELNVSKKLSPFFLQIKPIKNAISNMAIMDSIIIKY